MPDVVPAGWGDGVSGRSTTCFMAVAPWWVAMPKRWRCETGAHIGRPTTPAHQKDVPKSQGHRLSSRPRRPSSVSRRRTGPYAEGMSRSRRWWSALAMPAAWTSPGDLSQLPATPRTRRDLLVDAAGCLAAAAIGALFLTPDLRDSGSPLSTTQLAADISCGALACILLWWRRRWPLGIALACAALGMVSTSATPAGLLALSSLAVYRPIRPVLLVAVLWIPCVLVFAAYSPTTGPISVFLLVTPLVLAAIGWGMFLRARRELLQTLRERATRAERDQRLPEEQARTAERTRIAREMHDVLAHRISLLALHAGALEVRPDLTPDKVRETAGLLRSTARQALEELRGVV